MEEKKIYVATKPVHYCDGQRVYYYPDFTKDDAKTLVEKYEKEKIHMFSPYADTYDMTNDEDYNRWIGMFKHIVEDYPNGFSETWHVNVENLAKVERKGYLVVIIEPYND